MNRILGGALLLFASIALAQQQATPPIHLPPNTTPPIFPQERKPRPDVPPAHRAPDAVNSQLPAADLARQIQQKFDNEPILQSSTLRVAVDDANITLTGTVDNDQEHQIALGIAQKYAGDRNVVDRIKIRD